MEIITHVPNDREVWVCICKNTPSDYGFYPCDKDGNEIEPLIGSDWNGLYVCGSCRKIINLHTLKVIGKHISTARN